MLTLCTGHARKRIKLECTRFYSHHELFKRMRDLNKSIPIWFEYGPNLYQAINNDTELRFACQIIERDIESYMSVEDQEENRRMIIDQAHTKECEMREARRQRKENKSLKKLSTTLVQNSTMSTGTILFNQHFPSDTHDFDNNDSFCD
jgi:hypothetical protein